MNKTSNSEITLGPALRKIPSVAAGFSLTNLLNCADVGMALGSTGEEGRRRHSTAAYSSASPGTQLKALSSSITLYINRGIPGRGKETS